MTVNKDTQTPGGTTGFSYLLSISKAPREVASNLMKAHDIGQQCYSDQHLEKDLPVKKFHDPIVLNKLKSFSTLCKRKQVKSSDRVAILKADRSLFGRIIVLLKGATSRWKVFYPIPLDHYLGFCPHQMDCLEKPIKLLKQHLFKAIQHPVDQLPDNL